MCNGEGYWMEQEKEEQRLYERDMEREKERQECEENGWPVPQYNNEPIQRDLIHFYPEENSIAVLISVKRVDVNGYVWFCDHVLLFVVGRKIWRVGLIAGNALCMATPSDEALALILMETHGMCGLVQPQVDFL